MIDILTRYESLTRTSPPDDDTRPTEAEQAEAHRKLQAYRKALEAREHALGMYPDKTNIPFLR